MITFRTHEECTTECTPTTCTRIGFGTCEGCGATCVAVTALPHPRCSSCR